MDQSSVRDGELTREDQAIAVTREPMWKLAIVLHECSDWVQGRVEE